MTTTARVSTTLAVTGGLAAAIASPADAASATGTLRGPAAAPAAAPAAFTGQTPATGGAGSVSAAQVRLPELVHARSLQAPQPSETAEQRQSARAAELRAERAARKAAEVRAERKAEKAAELRAERKAEKAAEERAERKAEQRAERKAEERAERRAEQRAERRAEQRAERRAEQRAAERAVERSSSVRAVPADDDAPRRDRTERSSLRQSDGDRSERVSRSERSGSSVRTASTGSTAVSAGSTSNVVAIAKRYTGTPYAWGGSSPSSGFDCSGFTSYVFRQAGIELPHSSRAQRAAAAPVSNPQPGDLVFYGSPVYHVGIYVGNGQMIDSSRPGTTVQVRPVGGSEVSYGRVG